MASRWLIKKMVRASAPQAIRLENEKIAADSQRFSVKIVCIILSKQ